MKIIHRSLGALLLASLTLLVVSAPAARTTLLRRPSTRYVSSPLSTTSLLQVVRGRSRSPKGASPRSPRPAGSPLVLPRVRRLPSLSHPSRSPRLARASSSSREATRLSRSPSPSSVPTAMSPIWSQPTPSSVRAAPSRSRSSGISVPAKSRSRACLNGLPSRSRTRSSSSRSRARMSSSARRTSR